MMPHIGGIALSVALSLSRSLSAIPDHHERLVAQR
jgi:hypothetical protein